VLFKRRLRCPRSQRLFKYFIRGVIQKETPLSPSCKEAGCIGGLCPSPQAAGRLIRRMSDAARLFKDFARGVVQKEAPPSPQPKSV
jgi:hypothetical protein